MSCKWIDSTLGDFITFKNGKTSPDRNDGDLIPVYGSNGIIGYSTKNNAPENSLIIGRVGSYCGSVYHSPSNCWVTDNAIVGLPKHDSESEFWYFLLLTLKLNSYRSGSGQPLINQTTLKSISIRIPEESSVRSEIGKQLYLFNQKVDLNTQTNQTLEQIAQAIFKSWFVNFEPVKAKMAVLNSLSPRERVGVRAKEQAELAAMSVISGKDETALKQLQAEQPDAYTELAQTAALFPAAMVDSELGDIPEGWSVSQLRGLSEKISKGTTPRKPDISNATDPSIVPFIKVKDISDDGEINRGSLENIPSSIHEKALKRSILATDDLLFSIAGTIGRVSIIDDDLDNSNTNQAVAFVRLSDKEKFLELCLLTLKSKRVQEEIKSKVVQGVQANANLTNIGDIQVVAPDDAVLKAWKKIIYPLISEKRNLSCLNRKLSLLRDTLLPKLLSGELTLPNTEEA